MIKACRNAKIQGNDRQRRDKSVRNRNGTMLTKKETVNKQMRQLESRLNQLQNAVDSTNEVDKMEVKHKGGLLRSKTVEMRRGRL
ncbi:hypothetical protein AAHB50_31460 [Bacillus toyonensis]